MAISNFESTIMEVKKLTADVMFFSLSAPQEFSFKAGQFITLRVGNREESRLKSYSILSSPLEKGKIELCIKIIDGGFASEIFKKAKKGDSYLVKGPFGHFIFEKDDLNQEIWLVGGGTGIAPLYSLLKENLIQHENKRFVLLFSVREKKDLFLQKQIKQLVKEHSNLTYFPTLTREKWEGLTGRVQEHLPTDLKNKTFYICGLKELVLETKEYLLQKGVDLKNVKFERYS